VRKILRFVVSFAIYVTLIFAMSLGLAMLWNWMKMPAGSSLSLHQVREAAGWAITFAIGFSLGEFAQRSRTKE
jgi:hypothetical protein